MMNAAPLRTVFDFGSCKTLGHWFPWHMGKGLRQMRALLQKVDCIIEVHDCRIPLSGRNPHLSDILSAKPKLLILNKVDMAQPSLRDMRVIQNKLSKDAAQDYLFAVCSSQDGDMDPSISQIIPRCVDLIEASDRHNREGDSSMDLMVVGIPNVGKSSLINVLRRKYLNKGNIQRSVAKSPGHTRSVMFKTKVCEKPLVHLYDTPGILQPNIKDLHSGMKLALCNAVNDHQLATSMLADYLLFVLNKRKEFKYVSKYDLGKPNDEIQEVLNHIALRNCQYQVRKIFTGTGNRVVKVPDYEYSAAVMLKDFREGHLGRFILDDFS